MEAHSPRPPREVLIAVALVSFCILAAEVALTRVFSVLFRAPYVFLILSGAIGGLGLGGLLVQAVRPSEERLRDWIVGLSLLLAVALATPVLVLFASPWGRDLVAQAETWVVVALPMVTFTVAGTLLSLLFRQYAASGGLLYFVDLAAAAAAAPITVLLLDRIGGLNTPLLLAALAALAGGALAVRYRKPLWVAGAVVLLAGSLGALGTNLGQPWIDVPRMSMPPEALNNPGHAWHQLTKPLFKDLADPYTVSKIIRTDWTAVSRTDVVQDDPQTFYIYTDGDVPTQMMGWDGSLDSARREYGGFIGALPYHLSRKKPKSVMAIGAGGGLDVLLAKAAGAERVDAVEINPSIPKVIQDPRFANTYARVYHEPGVRLMVDEGRSFLQRAGKYDVVYFACAKTATTQTGGVALLDNHLYTVEAFQDYWRHLTDEGTLGLVTQESFLIDRLLVTALTALRQEGVPIEEGMRHLITARIPPARFREGPYRHILLMSRRAWEPKEMAAVRDKITRTGHEPLYLPYVQPRGADGATIRPGSPLAEIQSDLEHQYRIPKNPGQAPGPNDELSNLSAVTDDSPFYVDIAHGLHPTLRELLSGAVLATLAVGLVVLGFGLTPQRRSEGVRPTPLAGWMLYFGMLGTGFMFVELALMQRFILLLGFPTRSLTVTLAALLLSSALGSWVTQRGTAEDARKRLLRLLPVLVALLLVYRFALAPVVGALLPLPLAVRIACTALLLLPAGFVMGMPFPTALRTLGPRYERLIPAFWSVNGVTSILGSVSAMALAKFIGYGGTLVVGAGCYAVAWAVAAAISARTSRADSTEMTVSPT